MCIQESGAKVTLPAKKQTPAAAKNGVAVVSKKKQDLSSSSEADTSSDEEPVSSGVPNIFFFCFSNSLTTHLCMDLVLLYDVLELTSTLCRRKLPPK